MVEGNPRDLPIIPILTGVAELWVGCLLLYYVIAAHLHQRTLLADYRVLLLFAYTISAGAYFILVPGMPTLALGLGLGIACSFTHPTLAAAFLLFNLILRPWEILPDGNQLVMMPRGLAALTLFSFSLHMIRRWQSSIAFPRILMLQLCAFGWFWLAAVVSVSPGTAVLEIEALMPPAIVICAIILNCIEAAWCLRSLQGAFVSAVIALTVIGYFFTAAKYPEWGPFVRMETRGSWGNSNDLAACIVTAIPMALVGTRQSQHGSIVKISCWVIVAILGYGLFLTQSRGGYIALAAAFLPLVFIRKSKKQIFLRGSMVAVSMALIWTMGITRDPDEAEESAQGRRDCAVVAFRMAASNPIFGVGPSNFDDLYPSFTTMSGVTRNKAGHNTWLIVLAESGAPGFVLFVLIVYLGARSCIAQRHSYPELLMSFLAYFTAVTFLSHPYSTTTYMLCAMAVAARRSLLNGECHRSAFESTERVSDSSGPVDGNRTAREQL